MSVIKDGSIVNCAFCKKDVAVQYMAEYEGIRVYNLACFHRNTFCTNCNQMAKDVSETISKVEKHCVNCDPPLEDD
jgi:hypothetical protein